MQRVYLDNAATTSIHPKVIDEMTNVMINVFGNPSSTHSFGQEAKAIIELARKNVSKHCNVSPSEIYFTSCGTESNNTIIHSCVNDLQVKRIITSDLEHKCVYETIKDLESRENIEVIRLNILKDGNIDYEQLKKILKDSSKKTLVSLMHANNEIGNITDIKYISKLCRENNSLFHTDTVQTVGHYDLDFQDLGMDFASCSAHKIHGPKGIGFLYAKKTSHMKPLIKGGGQERGMRSGTENIYGIVGLSKAIDLAIQNLDHNKTYIKDIKEYAIRQLKNNIPSIKFNGLSEDLEKSLYTLLNIRLPFHDDLIGFELQLNGIAASQGSACSSGASKTSSVISAICSSEEIKKITPLRISFSYETTKEDIDILINTLNKITKKNLV